MVLSLPWALMDRHLYNLIKKCRKNDRQAQFDLYQHCFDYLLAICFRYQRQRDDAVSLLNDAFLKILLNIETYDEQRDFLPWAATITVRTAIDQFRASHQYHDNTDLMEHDADLESVQMGPGHIKVIDELSSEEIQEMVFSLPEKERIVFVLYEWEGYKHHEIAEKLECSTRSSKRYLQSAKEKLKKELSHKQALKKVI